MWLFENISEIVLFLGAAQGLLLAVLIFQKHIQFYANRFLALLMLSISIILLYMIYVDLSLYKDFPYFLGSPLTFAFTPGPLIYLYAKYLTHPKSKFKRMEFLHFFPAAIFLIYSIPNLFTDPSILINAHLQEEKAAMGTGFLYLNWSISLQAFIYTFMAGKLVVRYRKSLGNYFGNIEKIKLDWLRNIIFTFMGTILVFITEIIFNEFGRSLSDKFWLTSLFTGTTVYALGYMGLLKSEVLTESHFSEIIPENIENLSPETKYQKSGLAPEKARQHLDDLVQMVEREELYMNSELTLNDLAKKMGISAHNLSEVINTGLNQNFFEFINRFRVETVKADLIDPEKSHLNILSLAYDAGFNSKTAFNTIFKKHTGLTPSNYRKQNQKVS